MTAASLQVGIAGAGSVALGTAALLCRNGHSAMLWSPSGASTLQLADGTPLVSTGAVEGSFHPMVAADARHLAESADVILIALPAYGHKAAMDALAPHIREGQPILISSHTSLGALYLSGLLASFGISAPITAWGTTVVTGRRKRAAEVNVNTLRAQVDICTVPDSATDAALSLCERLFGKRFVRRDGLLAISLSNLNPQNHMGIALGNISRMDRGETWSQGQNVTPRIGSLLEALDLERLEIAAALGLKVRTIFEHFHLSFHVPIASISEMNRKMHELGNGGTGPATADSRYVTEDVPYGLVATCILGELAGRPAKLHNAGIEIFSAMYGRNFWAENDLLTALELSRFSLEDLLEAARSGILNDSMTAAPGELSKL